MPSEDPTIAYDEHVADGTLRASSQKNSAEFALAHIHSENFAFLGTPSTTLRLTLDKLADEMSEAALFEIRTHWRVTDYFKSGVDYTQARSDATRLAELSQLYRKLSEHLDEHDGNTLRNYDYLPYPREDQMLFRSIAADVLLLEGSVTDALNALGPVDNEENRELMMKQREDLRGLPGMPMQEPGGGVIPLAQTEESDVSQSGSVVDEGSDVESEGGELGGYIEDSDASDE